MKTGVCEYCKAPLVVMYTQTGTVLPVERQEGQTYTDDDIFTYKKHKSHLLNCVPMRMNWNRERKKYLEIDTLFLIPTAKELCR